MSSSFEKINYSLRPNKFIERKMMSEALSRLSFLDHLDQYRYIGMGSPFFADFTLFHKSLGINDLISIEREESKKDRFEFNKPYSCIEMKYGESSTILPNLELNTKKNIVWLDYDDKISSYMFSDISTFFGNALPGSFFVLSVNVEEEHLSGSNPENLSQKEFRMNLLKERVGQERIPNEFKSENMNTKNLIDVAYEMVNRQIVTTLINRNGNVGVGEKVKYKQLFNFQYKDNATILTIGGIIFSRKQKLKIDKMKFEKLHFCRAGKDSYKIQAPNLTFREIKALDKALPNRLDEEKGKFVDKQLKQIPLIPTDVKKYAEVYRYFPTFAESIV